MKRFCGVSAKDGWGMKQENRLNPWFLPPRTGGSVAGWKTVLAETDGPTTLKVRNRVEDTSDYRRSATVPRNLPGCGATAHRRGVHFVRLMSPALLILSVACCGVTARSVVASPPATTATAPTHSRVPAGAYLPAVVRQDLARKWAVTNPPRFVSSSFSDPDEVIADGGGLSLDQQFTAFVLKAMTMAREWVGTITGVGLLVLLGVGWVVYRRVSRPTSFGKYDMSEEAEGLPVSRRGRRLSGRLVKNGKRAPTAAPTSAHMPFHAEAVTTDRPLRAMRMFRSRGLLKRRLGTDSP